MTKTKIFNFFKNKYVGEALGIAILILCVLALTVGTAFLQEHTLVILLVLLVIIVISGAI